MGKSEWKKPVAILWIAQMLGMSSIMGVISFLPLYVVHLGVDGAEKAEVWSGVLIAITSFFAGCSGPYWGSVGDRKGRKRIVEQVMFVFGLVMFAMAFVTNIYQLLCLRLIQGVFGGFSSAALALATSLIPEEETGFTMGIFQTALIVGAAVGPLLGGVIADYFGYRIPFVVFGTLCFGALLLIRFFIVEKFVPASRIGEHSLVKEIKTVFSMAGITSMLLVMFLIQFAIQIVAPVMPLFIRSLVVDSTNVASFSGTVFAVAGLASAIASVSIGGIGKRYTHKVILFGSSVLAAVFFVLQAMSNNVLLFGVFRALGGLCLGAMVPSANTVIAFLIPPEKRGLAYGISSWAALMGSVVGPLIGGFAAMAFGLPTVFWLTAVLFFLTAIWIELRVNLPAALA